MPTAWEVFRDASGLGQQVAASSIPVVLASDQGPIAVTAAPATGQEWTLVGPFALAASTQIKSSGGKVGPMTLRLDSTAPAGPYYVQLFDATSATGTPRASVKVIHQAGADDKITINPMADGVRFTTGISVGLSSTEATYTSGGAYLAVEAAEYKA